jgi:hypothetical protein
MKYSDLVPRRSVCRALASFLVISTWAVVPGTFAQVVNLTSGNSSATINTSGSGSGLSGWSVDGFNPVSQQWFWFRAGGMTSEQRINAMSAPSIVTPAANQARISYFSSVGGYGVTVAYVLNGQAPGSGLSTMTEGITITNGTASPLTFTFFQYSDFNLFSGGLGDYVSLATDPFSGEALQTNGPIRLAETSVTPKPSRFEANNFTNTIASLDDSGITVLNNNANAGPGNVAWAFEWDFTIAAGTSLGISKTLSLQIPEPSVAALVGCGLIGLALRRRRGKRS